MSRSVVLALALGLVACGAPSTNPDPALVGDDILAPPPAGAGIQLEMVSQLDAGQEIERCRFFQVGPEGLRIHREEVRYTSGSHHVLVFSTPYTSIPTKDHSGATRDTTQVLDCNDGAFSDWDVDGVIGGAQSPTAQSSDQSLPDGVALVLPPSAVVLMDAHFLNATAAPVKVTARINLWDMPPSTVSEEAGVMFFYNFYIRVPPFGDASAQMRCPIGKDVTLLDAQSHMHARGVGYEADLTDEDGVVKQPLYTNDSWSNVPVKTWPNGLSLHSGDWIDYRCDYHSNESRTIYQGLSTRDEMCMFVALYYPRDAQLERCALDDDFYTSDLAAMHVGHGAATCAQTRQCTRDAPTNDNGDTFDQCIDSMCPNAAPAYWAVDQCVFTHAHHACDTQCAQAGAACDDCVNQGCATENAACAAAGC